MKFFFPHIPKYKSLCCPWERIDFFFLLHSKWPVWLRGSLQKSLCFEKITAQPGRRRLNCRTLKDLVFYFSLSVSKTRASTWVPFMEGRGIFMWDKERLHENLGGLSAALYSLECNMRHLGACMCEWEALHTGGIWPKFNLSIVRVVEKKGPCLLKSHCQCCNAGV